MCFLAVLSVDVHDSVIAAAAGDHALLHRTGHGVVPLGDRAVGVDRSRNARTIGVVHGIADTLGKGHEVMSFPRTACG